MTSLRGIRNQWRNPWRNPWIVGVGLLVVGGCKGEVEQQPADPVEDPWIEAIETGDEQPAEATAPEAAPSAVAVAQPTTAVLATPTASAPASAPEPEPTPAASHVVHTPSAPAAVEPEPPAPEPPASDEPPTEPAPIAEPTPTPSPEPAAPPSPPPITSIDFHGSYRYAGGSSQRAELDAAIENTVTQLSRAIQGIARKRLAEANPVDGSVQITIVGDKITTSFESGFQVSCTIDGASVQTKGLGGEKLSVQVRAKGSKLIQHMQGKDGARTIVYTLSADRKTLSVHHKITADRLPEPLTYRLSYARK